MAATSTRLIAPLRLALLMLPLSLRAEEERAFKLSNTIPTSPGARTSFFSPDLSEFYLAVPRRGNVPAEIRVFKIQK